MAKEASSKKTDAMRAQREAQFKALEEKRAREAAEARKRPKKAKEATPTPKPEEKPVFAKGRCPRCQKLRGTKTQKGKTVLDNHWADGRLCPGSLEPPRK